MLSSSDPRGWVSTGSLNIISFVKNILQISPQNENSLKQLKLERAGRGESFLLSLTLVRLF